MKRLFFLRHAKSAWDDPALDDHDRPLAARGQRAAEVMARHMIDRWKKGSLTVPDKVLCSSALRAQETLAPLADTLTAKGLTLTPDPDVYTFEATALLTHLCKLSEKRQAVLVIGHNPAFETLVDQLAGAGSNAKAHGVLRKKYPTAALAEMDYEGPWAGLGKGCAALTGFTRPRDLTL